MQNMSLPNLREAINWYHPDEEETQQRQSYNDAHMHSRDSSSQSTTANSSPVSLTFSSRGRLSGSTSSLASTPPQHDPVNLNAVTRRALPAPSGVLEGSMEKPTFTANTTIPYSTQNSPVASRRDSRDYAWVRPNSFTSPRYEYDQEDHYYPEQRSPKRRRSGESAVNGLAARIVERLPSLSRMQRQRATTSVDAARTERSTPFLSRSNSFRHSFTARLQETVASALEPHLAASPIETIVEDDARDLNVYFPADAKYKEEYMDRSPAEPIVRSATPLLPPMMDSIHEREPIQSPLASPSIAAPSAPITSLKSPNPTPLASRPESPSLSTQPSHSSFNRSRATTVVSSSSDIPPLVIADANDEWADRLGHANFYISPEPYIPSYCDLMSCNLLRQDWETARQEFSKHLARTEAHFGVMSRTYKLTQEKWNSIDAEWKRNSEKAARMAAESGATPYPIIPIEPAPLPLLPTIDDSRLLSGYDMNIVGPMEQLKPQIQQKPSKRAALMKLLGLQVSPKV